MNARATTSLPEAATRRRAEATTDAVASPTSPLLPGQSVFRKASCSCGGGCPACKSAGGLNVSQPHDPAEIEADRLADHVMRMPAGNTSALVHTSTTSPSHFETDEIHRKCDACEEEELEEPVMRKEASASAEPPPETPPAAGGKPPSINSVITSGGTPLDLETRGFFEPRFGIDLGHVRVHTGADAESSARSINARAYTLGSDIVFGGGAYLPSSESGRHLLAHELAHVAQQPNTVAVNRSAWSSATSVDSRTIYRASGDLDDLFDSPSQGEQETGGSGGANSGGCPKVPTKLGDLLPEPSCPTATHIGTNEVARINFCLDSDQPIDRADLTQIAAIVSRNHPKTRFLIHGYASPEGNKKYNFNLACHRANRIADEFFKHIRTQVIARIGSSGDPGRTNEAVGTEFLARVETAAQGPTSAFGSPDANRLVIVYAQIPGTEADEEPSCEETRRGIGDIKPEVSLHVATVDLTEKEGGPHLTQFHFCLDSDVLAGTTPADIREFAHEQASKTTFVIHGFSSEEGDAEYNRRLASHRALRIARELSNAGVPPEQIREVSGIGETNKFGNTEFNRVAVVLAEGGEIDELETGKRDATNDKQKAAIVEEAKQRILTGQYNLGADAYISFWTCGRTRTVSEAVQRLIIGLPRNNDNETRREAANGTEEGFGVNSVRISNVALRADNPIECTMGRLIDMSFHHALLGNPDLPRDLTRRFDPTAKLDDPINRVPSPVADPKTKDARHQAGLHLIHLAGLAACEGDRTKPENKPGTEPTGIDAPLIDDPRSNQRAPACAEAPQQTRLHFPIEGAKGREAPTFEPIGTPAYIPFTGKLTTNFKPGEKGNPDILLTRPEKDILTAKAEVQLSGDPATFSDYEIGFIQSVIMDETQADYDTGHAVIQELPVPIRHAAMRGDVPVPAPWTTLDSMATPGADGRVKLSSSGIGLNSETAINLQQLEPTVDKESVMSRFEEGTRIAIWLIARRRGAPLDRFSIHFIDGVMYDVTQTGRVEHRHARGDMFVGGGGGLRQTLDPSLGGEGEVAAYVGGFHATKPTELPADPSQMRFHGAVSSDIRLPNKVMKIVKPSAPTAAAMGSAELTAVVGDILDNLEVFDSFEDAVQKTGGKKTPRLGFDFIPLKITLPFVRTTGRLQLADAGKIVSTVEGPGLGHFASFHVAKALEFRIHHHGNDGQDVIVQPGIFDGKGKVVVDIPARPRDPNAPPEQESDLTRRSDVLADMAEAWACTERTALPVNIMVGAREFARVYSMNRDKEIAKHPSDRLQAGEEDMGSGFKTPMDCPDRPDAVRLGSFHTHPEVEEDPVASQADMDYVRGCGGAQHFIVTDNKVFRIQPDGSTKPVPVTLAKGVKCRDINLEDIIKIKKEGDDDL